jgi:predicted transcriptional regulator
MNVEDQQRRTSLIVAAYVRKNLISTDQIAGLINSVHSTLSGLGNEVIEEPPRVPAVSIRRSVHADYIICIECGYKGKMLKRHLQSSGENQTDESPPIRGIQRLSGSFAGFHLSDSFH